jgi:hypothetical protein
MKITVLESATNCAANSANAIREMGISGTPSGTAVLIWSSWVFVGGITRVLMGGRERMIIAELECSSYRIFFLHHCAEKKELVGEGIVDESEIW